MDALPPPNNRVIAALDTADRAELLTITDPVDLRQSELLYERNRPIEYVYFPLEGVVSLVAVGEDGDKDIVEVATVGNEGIVGLPAFLGGDQTSLRAFIQIPGHALRARAEAFKEFAAANPVINQTILRYTQALITQISQSAACNRLHTIEERCARWLLQTHDRVQGDDFPLTQQFLSQMLGTRRAAVNLAARTLQHAGLITYRRGGVTILDRAELENVSCECYGIITSEFERLLGAPTERPPFAPDAAHG
jgi:CRP-like cAMP-binding protein